MWDQITLSYAAELISLAYWFQYSCNTWHYPRKWIIAQIHLVHKNKTPNLANSTAFKHQQSDESWYQVYYQTILAQQYSLMLRWVLPGSLVFARCFSLRLSSCFPEVRWEWLTIISRQHLHQMWHQDALLKVMVIKGWTLQCWSITLHKGRCIVVVGGQPFQPWYMADQSKDLIAIGSLDLSPII